MSMSIVSRSFGPSSDGDKLRRLLFESHGWVNRRVDAVRLGSSGTTRRHVSLDLTLQKENAISGSKGKVVIPIAILQKVPLRGFNITHAGKSLSVLGIADSENLTRSMLMRTIPAEVRLAKAARAGLRVLIEDAVRFQPLRERLSDTENLSAFSDVSDDESGTNIGPGGREHHVSLDADDVITQRMHDWLSEQVDLPERQWDLLVEALATIEQFIRNFVLLAEVDDELVGTRSVVKYALDQDFPDRKSIFWHEIPIIQIIPDYGFARSQHIEFEVPAGLIVNSLELVPLDSKRHPAAGLVQDRRREQSRAAHVHAAPDSRLQDAVFLADIAPASQGLLTFASWAVIMVFVAAMLSIPLRLVEPSLLDSAKLVPSPAASLLLIGPALLLSWMAKEPEHRSSAMILFPLRAMLLIDAVALLFMACLAAVPTVEWVWATSWSLIYGLVSLALCWLILYRWVGGRLASLVPVFQAPEA
jgi:hypothetical protein